MVEKETEEKSKSENRGQLLSDAKAALISSKNFCL